jgi:polysaccharide deacetylase family sporulation protein PdaB
LGGITALFALVYHPAFVGASATSRQLPVYSVERDGKFCALSFDAAWGNEDTPELIRILDSYGVKATFFVVGDWVRKYPESVKALADAGHEVMNHSNHHDHFNPLTAKQITGDVSACAEEIAAITGKKPNLFRCPYGEYDDHVIAAVESLGITCVQWDVDSLDWKGISANEITQRVLKNVRSGSIILFHNAAEHTPEALPGILESLQSQGFTIVPISQLLLQGDTYQDNAGRQCRRLGDAVVPYRHPVEV